MESEFFGFLPTESMINDWNIHNDHADDCVLEEAEIDPNECIHCGRTTVDFNLLCNACTYLNSPSLEPEPVYNQCIQCEGPCPEGHKKCQMCLHYEIAYF